MKKIAFAFFVAAVMIFVLTTGAVAQVELPYNVYSGYPAAPIPTPTPTPSNKVNCELDLSLRTSAAKNGMFLNYTEPSVSCGKWIVFDPGWLNFGQLGYGEGFVGGGYIFTPTKRTTVVTELYVDRSYGPLSDHATYLQTFLAVSQQFGKGFSADTSLFPYIPMDRKGTKQFVVDHLALRKKLNEKWTISAGYQAYRFGNNALQNREYGSFTYTTKTAGALETMLMHFPGLPGGTGVQFRYTKNFNFSFKK